MKIFKLYLYLFALVILLLPACSKILDKLPQDKFSDQLVFTDINLADRYLLDTYNQSLIGGVGYISFASLTDESHDTHAFETANYLQGNVSPSATGPFGNWAFNYTTWGAMYKNIQKLNVFLASIEQVPNAYPEAQQASIKEKAERMKGEALFLRAFCYNQLARNYGGLILITSPFQIGGDYLSIKRSTFKETVDFISAQCDTAATLLSEKADMEMGRATKAAALSLKSRILLFAASDLTADGSAENELYFTRGKSVNLFHQKIEISE